MTDLNPDGETAIEALIAEATAPAPAKKRKKSTSPTARTLAECRKRGWIAQVVERWSPYARKTLDLFNVIDVVAIARPSDQRPAAILGIQTTSGAHHADRRDKILAEPKARAWVEAGGRLELWSWSKRGGRYVTRKKWELRVEVFTPESAWATPEGSGTADDADAPTP
jgi:hypothetical protein